MEDASSKSNNHSLYVDGSDHMDVQEQRPSASNTQSQGATMPIWKLKNADGSTDVKKPKKQKIKWDEDTIAEHDKLRGTRWRYFDSFVKNSSNISHHR